MKIKDLEKKLVELTGKYQASADALHGSDNPQNIALQREHRITSMIYSELVVAIRSNTMAHLI